MESYLLFGASFQILTTERKCAVGLRSAGIAALNDWLKNLTPLRDKKTEPNFEAFPRAWIEIALF